MKVTTGVDLIEIARVREAMARHGQQFLDRIFTESELVACAGRVESLAARFAAKEAAAKALGRGIGDVGWHDIEIAGDENKAPRLVLHGGGKKLAEQLGLSTWSLSMSHTHEHAVALVVAMS